MSVYVNFLRQSYYAFLSFQKLIYGDKSFAISPLTHCDLHTNEYTYKACFIFFTFYIGLMLFD